MLLPLFEDGAADASIQNKARLRDKRRRPPPMCSTPPPACRPPTCVSDRGRRPRQKAPHETATPDRNTRRQRHARPLRASGRQPQPHRQQLGSAADITSGCVSLISQRYPQGHQRDIREISERYQRDIREISADSHSRTRQEQGSLRNALC